MLLLGYVLVALSEVTAQRVLLNPATYRVPEIWRNVLHDGGKKLGSGGNGYVYRAITKCGDNSHVAVKYLVSQHANSNKCLDAFKEVRVQQQLALEGFAPLVFDTVPGSEESCEPHTVVHISMECAHGDLGDLIKGLHSIREDAGPASHGIQVIAASVAESLVKAFAMLHDTLGLLHGDLKADNVFIFVKDRVGDVPHKELVSECLAGRCRYVLGDFGSACTEPCSRKPHGTRGYWAPEILKRVLVEGKVSMTTNRARDYYAFGQIIWRILMGTGVWRIEEMLQNGRYQKPDPVSLPSADSILQIAFEEFDSDRLAKWSTVKLLVSNWLEEINISSGDRDRVERNSLPCVGECVKHGCATFSHSQQVCTLQNSTDKPVFTCAHSGVEDFQADQSWPEI
eukprot:TRINITY_DN27230_c0_g1_i1.p1 TRINITY_DN27230_c0_g1~~TRINITY_DN27230_c0_g1_i1.p1  ORF type:complete len:398 (+),score=44.88 TRINITY_DN27230_c0_g1_i1:68-1261(+)